MTPRKSFSEISLKKKGHHASFAVNRRAKKMAIVEKSKRTSRKEVGKVLYKAQ